jgi:hypothetical protein
LPNSTAAVSCTIDMPPSGEKDAQAAIDSCVAIASPILASDPELGASLTSAPHFALFLLGRHVAPTARFHGPERLCPNSNVGGVNWRTPPLRVSRRHYPFGGRNGAS